MKKLAINSGDAFILVYSVDDPKSFDDLEQLREQILCEREQAYLEATNSNASMNSNDSAAVISSSSSTSIHHQQANNNVPSNGPFSKLVSQSSSTSSSGSTNSNTGANQALAAINGTLNCIGAPVNASSLANTQTVNLSCGGQQQTIPELTQSHHHWSLTSLFNHYSHLQSKHNNNNNNSKQQFGSTHSSSAQVNGQQQQFEQQALQAACGHSSLGSSICSSSNSCSSSTENSRRSSISAAEAALRTRRTRRPPMVIVANKYDLPKERHLVNSDEIEAVAVIDWNNGFVRASAALNWNVDEIFQQVLKQAKQPPTLTEAIVSKRRKSLPPKLPQHP